MNINRGSQLFPHRASCPHVGYSCQVYLLAGNVGYTECFNKKKSPICFAKNILDKENEIRGLWHLPNV